MPKLSDTQLVILNAAARREDRLALPLPTSLRGDTASRNKILKRLVNRKLLREIPAKKNALVWREDVDRRLTLMITDAGLAELGLGVASDAPTSDQAAAASTAESAEATSPRAGSKLDRMLSMLREGATVDQMVAATGWQAHTVRAAITGLRKRGYVIDRTKPESGETLYAIREA